MSVRKYTVDGKTLYEVYVSERSKTNRMLRIQKKKRGYETKAEAERAEKKLISDCAKTLQDAEGLGDKWGEVVLKYRDCRLRYSKIQRSTVDEYVTMMKIWTEDFWNKPISEVTRNDVRNSIEKARVAGKSNSLISKLLHTIGRIHNWAREEGVTTRRLEKITAGIKVDSVEDKDPPILNSEQLRIFMYEAQRRESEWFHIWAMGVLTGMRSSELVALKWDCVDLQRRIIHVNLTYNKKDDVWKIPKGKRCRTVPINESLREILLELKASRQNEFVLPRLAPWMRGEAAAYTRLFCKEIGVPQVTFHALRACWATTMLASGVPLTRVMKCGGWAELRTMQRYNRMAGVDERGATDCLDSLMPNFSNAEVLDFCTELQTNHV